MSHIEHITVIFVLSDLSDKEGHDNLCHNLYENLRDIKLGNLLIERVGITRGLVDLKEAISGIPIANELLIIFNSQGEPNSGEFWDKQIDQEKVLVTPNMLLNGYQSDHGDQRQHFKGLNNLLAERVKSNTTIVFAQSYGKYFANNCKSDRFRVVGCSEDITTDFYLDNPPFQGDVEQTLKDLY